MREFKKFVLIIAALSLLLGLGCEQRSAKERFKARRQQREVRGPFPSDWFLEQRLWPDNQLSPADYRQAVNEAERLARANLDTQPPWIPAGPNNIGGRVADVVGHPTDENLFYVAAASGGIFMTTNGGTSWTPIFDQAPGLSMGALAMDPTQPTTLYAGTGEPCSATNSYFGSGVYRSDDGGGTWTNIGLEDSRYIARIVIDPTNPQSIWVAAMGEVYTTGGQRGIYHSTNGGESWEQSLFVNDSTGASDVVIHPTNPQILYAGMWQRIRNPAERIAGGRGSGIFRTTNGGGSWERLTDGLPAVSDTVGRIGLAISQSQPDTLYACYANHPGYFMGVYRTNDGGETWGRVNDWDLSEIYSNFGWYFGNIRVRPDNPNIVFVLGVELARSTDGGQNWEFIGQNVHVDHHALWFHPATPTHILLGNDGGLYRSTNNGNSFTFRPGMPINQFYAASVDPQLPQRRYGGTQDQGTLRTTTGGLNDWTRIHGGDGFYVLVDPRDSDVIYAEYQWGWLEKSTDGGDWWEWAMSGIDETERTNWSTPFVISPHDPDVLYYGAERLYRSTNGALDWLPVSPNLTDGGGQGNITFGTITTISVSPLSPSVIYVGTDDANVWSTQNGGGNWQNRSAGLPNRWITRVAADPLDEATVYVTVSGFRNAEQDAHLFRSTDYGATWEGISGNLPGGPLNDVIPDPQEPGWLYVASDFGTYASPDYGGHWVALGEDLPRVPVLDLVYHHASRQLVAATFGRSMFTLSLNSLELGHPPLITSHTPADLDTARVDQTILFAVDAEDPDGDSLRFIWLRNGNPIGTDSSIEITFTEAGLDEQIAVEVSDTSYTTRYEWEFYVDEAGSTGDEPGVVASHLLMELYPNPFNATATIDFQIPVPGVAELAVYDVTGRRVATLLAGPQPAGRGHIAWNANALPSGNYFLKLTAAGQTRMTKALLIR